MVRVITLCNIYEIFVPLIISLRIKGYILIFDVTWISRKKTKTEIGTWPFKILYKF